MNRNKHIDKTPLIKEQNGRCFYCNIKFDYKNKWKHPTLEHLKPYCQAGHDTKFAIACKRCNHLKGNIPLELYLDGYICVNFKPGYDAQSYNKAIKVRKPINWYQRLFPSIFWWSGYDKKYQTTIHLY